ncbi:MAG: TIGR01777 family protein [Corynebacteriales bacterium]|nr:TIGR01777 family protein [Mycobacteriales bacterium]
MPVFNYESVVNAPLSSVFAWHRRPGAIQRLIPPWAPARVQREAHNLEVGERARVSVGPIPIESVHTALTEPHEGQASFVDELRKGPIKQWRHHHEFTEQPEGTLVRDTVKWSAPWIPDALIKKQLTRMFTYRHHQLATDLAVQGDIKPMTIAITGASGLLGRQLTAFLTTGGHTVVRLVRRQPRTSDEIQWDPTQGTIDAQALTSCDAVVHLAGEPLFGRWSRSKMRKIRKSRLDGTELIARTLAELDEGPKTLIGASAIGYYASTSEPIDEDGPKGTGFLADLVEDWENATALARDAGLRVVHVRTGLVLSPRGGFLGLQLPPFHAGLGGWLGNGRQMLSWIAQDDIVYLLHHALTNSKVRGVLNMTSPHPVTGREFARTLAKVLHRPALIPVPLRAIEVALGKTAAEEFAGASQWVLPGKALATDYTFRYPNLQGALQHLLGR